MNPRKSSAVRQEREEAYVLTCLDHGGREQTLQGLVGAVEVRVAPGYGTVRGTCQYPRPAGAQNL